MKTDNEIHEDVMNQLKWDPFLNASDIGVTVKNGVVTLSGQVDSFSKKIEAEQVVKKIAGVRAVAEDIIVGVSPDSRKTDGEIAAAVLNALKWNSTVNENQIAVKVEDGIVVLEGEVEWEYQRQSAKNAVAHLTGVRSVINTLRLKLKATPKDIQLKITEAFHRAATVDAGKINIDIVANKAVLTGNVRSFAEKQDAEEAAWKAPGITVVENQLKIIPQEEYAF